MGSIGFFMLDQMRRTAKIVYLFPLAATILSSCNNLKLESRWRDRDISIDGLHSEWEGALMFSEEKRATVGFINDDKYLYLCLMAADQHILMQSLAAGFTVWFDGMGRKKEKFGIKYPIGMENFQPDIPRRNQGRPDGSLRPEILEEQSDLVIVRSEENEKLSLSEAEEYGISIKTGQHLGRFIYELKIPLYGSGNGEYSIVPKDDGTIRVGFELGKMEMRERERRPPGDRGGFTGGMRPPDGSGMRGPRGGNRPDRPDEFGFQIKVKLAKKPISTNRTNGSG